MWPEIRRMAEEEIAKGFQNGHKVIILDAAVLLTAKWHEQMKLNQIWVSIVDPAEAVKRIVDRDGKTEVFCKLENYHALDDQCFAFFFALRMRPRRG